MKNTPKNSKFQNCVAYIFIVLFLFFIIFTSYEYFNKFYYIFKSPIALRDYILSSGNLGILTYLLIHIIQVVVFFIPGGVVQIAGGFIYGSLLGTILSITGITIGDLIIFCMSRVFGKPLVFKIIPKKPIDKFNKFTQDGDLNYVVFIFYLIPGISKDILGYLCGLTDIKLQDYLIYSTIGRIPAIIMSSIFGSGIINKNVFNLVIISIIFCILFAIGALKGEKLLRKRSNIKETK